jgi:diaminohydroxyphosphoribosylaminopyrimidine deaminase/5-amino-6-(5-phosphoribosylamino)uracil reductase
VLFDETVLSRAIELAKLGIGSVSPNPMVGAVIIHQGKIIGEGYHQKYGEAHAEVNAINDVFKKHINAPELLKEATIYVTLEPCAHFGKTPPCADLIIKNQIPRAVIGCRDPFAKVNGMGIQKLKDAGIEVIVGVLEQECIALNKRFFTSIAKQRPYIILKWAQTADGFFASNNHLQKWISSSQAKQLVHQWRAEEDCILIGKNTALIDNPQLNVRLATGKNPIRAIVDKNLTLPKTLHVFDNSIKTLVFNKNISNVIGNTYYIGIEDFDYFLPQYILYQMYLQDIQSVIIEGGVKLLQSFINCNLWDETRIFTAPIHWGEGLLAPSIKGNIAERVNIGEDQLTILSPLND